MARTRIVPLGVLAIVVSAAIVLPAQGKSTPKITGLVGPGFTISMGAKPTKAGTYSLVITDKAKDHNFRLKGPGVNVATGIAAVGTKTFTVTLKKGKYTFVCDPHAAIMKGSFTIK